MTGVTLRNILIALAAAGSPAPLLHAQSLSPADLSRRTIERRAVEDGSIDIEKMSAAGAVGTTGSVAPPAHTRTVTPNNFLRAESDRYFAGQVHEGRFGTLVHQRNVVAIDKQFVVRPNRDTLYSTGVFDLDAGAVTVTLPGAGKRFMSLIAIDEDHYVHGVVYLAGSYSYSKEDIGTRYVLLAVRTLVDPASPADVEEAHALQDAIIVTQRGGGSFEVPDWDQVSQTKVREALEQLGQTVPDSTRTFGSRYQVDPVRHLIGTAVGWGGNSEKDALYLPVTPEKNDGTTIYRLTVKDVPVDGFWSISVYDAEGYFEANPYDAYSLNNITAKKSTDGSIAIQFGGCDPPSPIGFGGASARIPNCLPTMRGWNYTVRLYRPRASILNGTWTFPSAQPASAQN